MDTTRDTQHWKSAWTLDEGVTYLNHGSFGPSPDCVRRAREQWSEQLERQPMDFFIRRAEDALDATRQKLGEFIGTPAGNLSFVDNATFGMNVAADTIPLGVDDEVLLTDLEYGAVTRIWRRRCRDAGARLVTQPLPITKDASAAVDTFFNAVTDRTRVIVVSHVTSSTAVILPVEEICRRAKARDITVCIDGPHAVAMIPLNVRILGCDFYTASCHKWLCGPFGSGFLYVSSKWQPKVRMPMLSWGGSLSGRPVRWQDDFDWVGTRDPAAFLALSAAIDFMRSVGVSDFRSTTHAMVRDAAMRLTSMLGREPIVGVDSAMYGSMISVRLPQPEGWIAPINGQCDPLQRALWERHRIEIPITGWNGQRLIRVSCHLYNDRHDVDHLLDALHAERDLVFDLPILSPLRGFHTDPGTVS
ncbi:MAG: aminotransferase class V-fold PLP-dependent enzyme [Planctomycetota bacterium]|nr:aminotransferase class V-fold PLP-dependent enzyme [Planctomycetota bacterium]